MEFLLVTGLSGSGKSQAIHVLEDIGFFCIDNIPPELIGKFFELCRKTDPNARYAAVIDIRSQSIFGDLSKDLAAMRSADGNIRLLFLDADDAAIIRRYKETRRRHPLMADGIKSFAEAVAKERRILAPVRQSADIVCDTTLLSAAQLRERILSLFEKDGRNQGMTSAVMSFGYKYGIPADADLVFDVRCLPNPFYVSELRPLNGTDPAVSGYVFGFEESDRLYQKIRDYIDYSYPLYEKEGKTHLVIAFGCTGGQHRSVAFAQRLYADLLQAGRETSVNHRDYKK